ncbi:MAG: hypothetical protein RIS64_4432 [Bacteroidota bacterium]
MVKKLAPLDKNLDRKLISWDEDVLLYEQGHIRGYGQCREYQFNGKVRTLYKGEIPKGKKFVAGKKCINLSNSRNLVADWVEEWGQDAIQKAKKASNDALKQTTNASEIEKIQETLAERLKEIDELIPRVKTAAYDLKANNKTGYTALLAQKASFLGWFYLREIGNVTSSFGNIKAWERVTTVCKLYTRNELLPEAQRAAYDVSFQLFSNEGGDMLNSLTLLSANNLLPEAFDKIVEASSQKKMLKDCFEDYAAVEGHQLPADLVEKRLAIIWNSEKKLAEAMTEGTHSLIPDLIWKEIRSLLTTTDAKYDFDQTKEGEIPLNGIRGKFSETINSILGMGVKDPATGNAVSLDWKTLLKITESKTGLITVQASRGSIFENWVREAWAKRNLFNSKQSNGGKLTFYFSAPRTPIAAATAASYKRVIDCSYTEKNTTPEDIKKNRCETVGVELKHTAGVLSGEPLLQLKDNAALVAANKLRRIEYLFSTKKAAEDNLPLFRNNFLKLSDLKVSYIDENGIKKELKL